MSQAEAVAMPKRQAAFREDFRSRITRFYIGPLHVLMIVAIGVAVMWYSIEQIGGMRWYDALVIPVVIVGANLFEWALHRYVMHRPIKGYGGLFYAIYTRHTLSHHQFFTNQEPTVDSTRDFRIVFFPPYAFATLLTLTLPFAGALALVDLHNMAWLVMATAAGVYLNYEFFHYCCHVKDDSIVRRIPLINTIRRHHIAHHDVRLMMEKNFNLTYPFADWLFGTSDLQRGALGHLFNGYETSHVVPSKRRIIGTKDSATTGAVTANSAAG